MGCGLAGVDAAPRRGRIGSEGRFPSPLSRLHWAQDCGKQDFPAASSPKSPQEVTPCLTLCPPHPSPRGVTSKGGPPQCPALPPSPLQSTSEEAGFHNAIIKALFIRAKTKQLVHGIKRKEKVFNAISNVLKI